ncbi:PE-PPE domain-containing protein [Mycobacterium sp. SMC-18]|uniref:PE-PPE domain-containing protein n=1 Tax=Mycobacteriaceae TaxID=1762 RepID=UPI001BB36C68|nr:MULTISPECIES: PE-PPE domain-containing protein [unclassified Mycolicibacterium]BCI83903.1 PE-PPE domain-containing protein [Mycolicibacterium sp. TY66]BCJ84477.1 PE-PPE domain-containing protein [Mycolicibacterium sp. TY81]
MRRAFSTIAMTAVAIVSSVLLLVSATFAAAIGNAAVHALIVPGTGNPTPDTAFGVAEVRNFVTPTNPGCNYADTTACSQTLIDYPASFWPIIIFGLKQLHSDTWNKSVQTGVDNLGDELKADYAADPTGHFYVVGYSQGGTVGSYFKNQNYPATGSQTSGLPPADQVTFVYAANPQRPNGGLFVRPGFFGAFKIPILDATVGIPAATDRGVRTSDIVIQYDGVSDFPAYPINLLADFNAIAGLLFIHPTYVFPNTAHPDPAHPYGYTVDEFTQLVNAAQTASDNNACTEAVHCQKYGDTTYITLPTASLPLLAPIRFIGERLGISAVTRPLTDLIEPALKVLIETGYDRTSYGTPTPFQVVMPLNPQKMLTLLPDLAKATVQGIHDAIGDITGTRPAPAPTQDPFASAVSLFTDSGGLAPAAATNPLAAAQTSPTTNKSAPPSTPPAVNLATSATTPTDPGTTTQQPSGGTDDKAADNPSGKQDQDTTHAKDKPEKKSKNEKAKSDKLGKGQKTAQAKREKGSESGKLGDKGAADTKAADKEGTQSPAGTPATAGAQN